MGKRLTIQECAQQYIKRNPSFVFYQTHTWNGEILIKGVIGNEKNSYILLSDIKKKTILDLGCATGDTSLWALENGAKKIIAIDYIPENIKIFSELASCVDKKNRINYYMCDLNNPVPNNIASEKIDTVFCFAITQYIKYRKIWREIPSAKVVYIMGGADSNYTEENLSDEIFTAKFITLLPNNNTDRTLQRKLFRLERKKHG